MALFTRVEHSEDTYQSVTVNFHNNQLSTQYQKNGTVLIVVDSKPLEYTELLRNVTNLTK